MWWSILRLFAVIVLCEHLVVTFGQIVQDSSFASTNSAIIASSSSSKKKATIVRKAFKQLLKVKSLPSVNRNTKNNYLNTIPPQYMLELYEKYRHQERHNNIKEINQRGNTVRSIVAVRGNINGDQMLVFNLSGIDTHEEMLRGELHFFKRRKIKWQRRPKSPPPEYRMKLFDITSENVAPLATSEVPREVHGWHVHDVTKMVKDCRTSSRWEQHLLGIKFEGLNKKLKFSSIPLNKFIKLNSLPFLIVFSNDPANNTINDLETHVGDKWYESETLTDDDDDDDEDYDDFDYFDTKSNQVSSGSGGGGGRRKDSTKNFPKTGVVNKTATGTISSVAPFLKRFSRSVKIPKGVDFNSRDSRSLLNNELPDNSIFSNYIPQTSPGILQSRNRQRQRNKPKTIPYPHRMTFGTNRKKVSKQQEENRQNRKLPKAWQEQQQKDHYHSEIEYRSRHENDATADIVNEDDVRGNNICRKQKLVVDFADIGWGEWIISPKSFEAQYCSGSCPFPLTKNMKPSNHATIQSIVHAIGMQPNVPAPCCVADTMSSVTLLYFDEDRNVVLKNYPGMTVESCACR